MTNSCAREACTQSSTKSSSDMMSLRWNHHPGKAPRAQGRLRLLPWLLACRKQGGGRLVRLLIQPGDGVLPLIKGINGARTSIEIVIFRFDRTEIERALANAVKRGVFVHALSAHMNRSGE